MPETLTRTMPIGAELVGRGAHFRVWAPAHERVTLVVKRRASRTWQEHACERERDGYHSLYVEDVSAGDLYGYRLDGDDTVLPDPASRFQPDGPHRPSELVDPAAFGWKHAPPRPLDRNRQVIYELHVGTFSEQGTFLSAIAHLRELADTGITMIEVMPVNDFPGDFGWGYDGVDLFAPAHVYGKPDDFRRFVDEAHAAGLFVILDVVYNHIGPDGNYLTRFSPDYFTDKYDNEWGDSLNFDGKNSAGVREFFRENAGYWIREFHLDGLRLDATQSIFDASEKNILAEISAAARAAAADRTIYLVAENEPQDVKLIEPSASGGCDLDALWNDDFHHSARVALTGKQEAYYTDYFGRPQEFVSAAKYGFLYQGQFYSWQEQRRGTDSRAFDPRRFVWYLENHDQVANSTHGLRLDALTSRGKVRAMTALLLLGPGTPMLFQGQEFASTKPFIYFADHHEELAPLVAKGRREFLSQFRSTASREMQSILPVPHDRETFEACRLDWSEREKNRWAAALHRDLLALRTSDPVISKAEEYDGAVLSDQAFLLRYFSRSGDDRLLLVNLGKDLRLSPAPEPLLAPPQRREWTVVWSSEAPEYGGNGTPDMSENENWTIPAESALLFQAKVSEGGKTKR